MRPGAVSGDDLVTGVVGDDLVAGGKPQCERGAGSAGIVEREITTHCVGKLSTQGKTQPEPFGTPGGIEDALCSMCGNARARILERHTQEAIILEEGNPHLAVGGVPLDVLHEVVDDLHHQLGIGDSYRLIAGR